VELVERVRADAHGEKEREQRGSYSVAVNLWGSHCA
jgi:hypothetical protein